MNNNAIEKALATAVIKKYLATEYMMRHISPSEEAKDARAEGPALQLMQIYGLI